MSNIHSPSFTERVGQRLLQNAKPNLSAVINSHTIIGNGLVKVVATITGNFGRDAKSLAKATRTAIHSSVPGTFCINNSFRVIPDTGDSLRVVGFLAANRQSKVYEAAPNLKVIATNVLMDDVDQSVWELAEVGGKKVMFRQGQEDLSEVLELAHVRDTAAPRVDKLTGGDAHINEYASWVDAENKDVRYGYVVASNDEKTLVVSRSTGDLEQIDNRCLVAISNFARHPNARRVVASLAKKGQQRPQVLSAMIDKPYESYDFSQVDYNNIRDYYKAVFAYAPEYYAEFERIIDHYGF